MGGDLNETFSPDIETIEPAISYPNIPEKVKKPLLQNSKEQIKPIKLEKKVANSIETIVNICEEYKKKPTEEVIKAYKKTPNSIVLQEILAERITYIKINKDNSFSFTKLKNENDSKLFSTLTKQEKTNIAKVYSLKALKQKENIEDAIKRIKEKQKNNQKTTNNERLFLIIHDRNFNLKSTLNSQNLANDAINGNLAGMAKNPETVQILKKAGYTKEEIQQAQKKANSIDWKKHPGEGFDRISSKILSNPVFLIVGIVGLFKLIFGDENSKMAKVGMAFLGLLAGATGAGKMFESVAKDLGWNGKIGGDNENSNNGGIKDKSAKITKYAKEQYEKAATALGTTTEKVKEAFNSKNDDIKETLKIKVIDGKKLDSKKIDVIVDNVGIDENFKKKTTDNILKTKISELSEETQEKLKGAGIKEDSPEFKAYLEVFKEKMVEAKSKNDKINNVGAYYNNGVELTADNISVGVGAGLMAGGILFKSPKMILVGATAVGAGLYGAWEKFFNSDAGQTVEKEVNKIINTNDSILKDFIKTKKLDPELEKSIYALLKNKKFDDIKNELTKNHPNEKTKLIAIANRAEELSLKTQAEAIIDSNFFTKAIDSIYKIGEETVIKYTDGFDKKKAEINKAIQNTKDLITKIDSSTLSNKSILVAQLEAKIAEAEAQISGIEANKYSSKVSNVEDINTEIKNKKIEIEKLNKKIPFLRSEISKLDYNDLKQRAKIKKKEAEIKKIEAEIKKIEAKIKELKGKKTKAKQEVGKVEAEIQKTKTDNFMEKLTEKQAKLDKLTTDLEKQKTKPDHKKIEKIINNYNILLKDAKDAGKEDSLDFSKFEEVKTKLTDIIKEKSVKILTALDQIKDKTKNLSEYKDLEISKQIKLLETVLEKSESKKFEKDVKDKKIEIFEDRIPKASIEEVQFFRDNFILAGIDMNKIDNRLKILAKSTLAKNDEEINKLIEKIPLKDGITKDYLENFKEKSILNLFKEIQGSPIFKNLTKKISEKYNLKIEQKTTKNNTKKTIATKENTIENNQITGNLDDLYT